MFLRMLGMLAAALLALEAAAVDASLANGSGSFAYAFTSAEASRTIRVWYHRPADAGPDAPVVFVLHGDGRNASGYRDAWVPHAQARRFIVVAPEFSRVEFPGSRAYNLGNTRTRDGAMTPQAQWTYTAIESLFDALRAANGLTRPRYDLYGHSAGGQFVHRLVMFNPDARFRVAVAANAGWYLMPDEAVAYPYGLLGSGIGSRTLARAFTRPLIVLLGDADTDPHDRQLHRSAGALAQGAHRYARGQAFFEQSQRAAASMGVAFAWQLEIAPGVAHSNTRMSAHAARFVGNAEIPIH